MWSTFFFLCLFYITEYTISLTYKPPIKKKGKCLLNLFYIFVWVFLFCLCTYINSTIFYRLQPIRNTHITGIINILCTSQFQLIVLKYIVISCSSQTGRLTYNINDAHKIVMKNVIQEIIEIQFYIRVNIIYTHTHVYKLLAVYMYTYSLP